MGVMSSSKISSILDKAYSISTKQELLSLILELREHEAFLRNSYEERLKNELYRDLREGSKTYGYSSVSQILSDLYHISDRFNCCFRLRWLLDLLEIDFDGI